MAENAGAVVRPPDEVERPVLARELLGGRSGQRKCAARLPISADEVHTVDASDPDPTDAERLHQRGQRRRMAEIVGEVGHTRPERDAVLAQPFLAQEVVAQDRLGVRQERIRRRHRCTEQPQPAAVQKLA